MAAKIRKTQKKVTVHRFRVQRSGLRAKKALKSRSPRYKCAFPQIIANLAPNFGLGWRSCRFFRKYASQMQSRDENGTLNPEPLNP